jgi:sugar lactone lactonase YvrE
MDATDAHPATTGMPAYEPVPNWGWLPLGMSLAGDATSVAVDSEDNVYVFNRGTAPVVVLDRDGRFIESWGAGEFDKPHGIYIDEEDHLYLVDAGGHFVQKRTREGKLLFTIGTPGQPAPLFSGQFFNQPTDLVVDPSSGDLFITDGYGNAHVHRFSAEGEHIMSFGAPGGDDGQLNLPHGIELYADGLLIVCDRENFRLQIFTTGGEYVDQWHAFRPSAVCREESQERFYVAELGTGGSRHMVANYGHRFCVRSRHGEQLAHFGAPLPGFDPDQFFAPHAIAIDSRGDIYVAEVNCSFITTVLRGQVPAIEPPSLRKWRRVSDDE